MQRRSFLQLSAVSPAIAFSLPPLVDPRSPEQTLPRKATLVRAGEDRTNKPFTVLEATFTVKVSGKDTEGRCAIFDTLRPAKVGPGLHIHDDCDEWFFVMDGEFKFQAGEEFMRLKAGDSLMVPQGVQHSFVKTSEGVARLIVMHQPAGTMEEYFREVALLPDLSPEDRQVLAAKHGFRIIGPRLTPD